jgi:hypothetical protein
MNSDIKKNPVGMDHILTPEFIPGLRKNKTLCEESTRSPWFTPSSTSIGKDSKPRFIQLKDLL